jgi:hypothetical protein
MMSVHWFPGDNFFRQCIPFLQKEPKSNNKISGMLIVTILNTNSKD